MIVVFFLAHAIPIDPVVPSLGQKAMDNPMIVEAFRQNWKPNDQEIFFYELS
jgi:ABC-type dipeptide/oligopeptide/nickel transport system permease component